MLPLSRRGLTVLNWLIVASAWLFIAVYKLEGAFRLRLSMGLLAIALVVLRVVHHFRYSPPIIYKPLGEDLDRARVESGREWLPILDEQRRILAEHQNLLLDKVASLLARLSSPLSSPVTANWWFEETLTISVPMEGQDDLALEVPYESSGALISVGRVATDDYDAYDNPWESILAIPMDTSGEAIVLALRWLEGEILDTSAADGEAESHGEPERDA